ncbi:PEP-utilizing enzyme [Streptomyces sp. NPDC059072]|uniref:PEP-utilizing enzyme n=1 Tax=Streptomyces sp. NPDC059072 TaxID=3346715 RepID=UPI0036BBFD14
MKRAAAIVTDHDGHTSHAAIVSRKLGVSAVVGRRYRERHRTAGRRGHHRAPGQGPPHEPAAGLLHPERLDASDRCAAPSNRWRPAR